jgi:hypothetical protein
LASPAATAPVQQQLLSARERRREAVQQRPRVKAQEPVQPPPRATGPVRAQPPAPVKPLELEPTMRQAPELPRAAKPACPRRELRD